MRRFNNSALIACFALCWFVGQADSQKAVIKPKNTKANNQAPSPATPSKSAQQNTSDGGGNNNQPQKIDVGVVSIPEVRVNQVKDSRDTWTFYCTIALTAVGILGTAVALLTLCAIRTEVGAAVTALGHSHKLAEAADQMFRLTHRPKVIVRNIVIPELKSLNRHSPMNQWTQQLTGYYTVANIGGLPATISNVIEGTWVDKHLPMGRPDRLYKGRPMKETLQPGESKEIDFINIILDAQDAMGIINKELEVYFLVQIDYVDVTNLKRSTSACRRYDPNTLRFTREDNPDYEYAD